MYNDVKLEKGMYNLSGKNFTTALEELDPSAEYIGTDLESLDAFERQLKRFNIRVNGENCDCVEKFFHSTESAVLFPEYVKRCIAKGFDGTVLNSVTAVRTVCESGQYLGCVMDDSAEYTSTLQSTILPSATVKEGTTAVVLEKFGRLINASYEAVRKQRLDVFGVMLRSIGVKLAVAVVKKAVSVLSENAEQISVSSLTYSSLAELYGLFDCFDMTTVVVNPKTASKIAAMEQLSDTKISSDGKMILPFGSELVKTSAVGENTIIGIDRNFALEFITSSGLVLETDKLIDRQLDQITVSITCGFRKITPNAVNKIVIA
ncbi:MAG: phage major capsid protein [Ruminococcus sp.]|nr:phage major capsid protein [Ruminococcus sp.]MDE7225840.1 phage major capsid protein [Ruminococcus sp.]